LLLALLNACHSRVGYEPPRIPAPSDAASADTRLGGEQSPPESDPNIPSDSANANGDPIASDIAAGDTATGDTDAGDRVSDGDASLCIPNPLATNRDATLVIGQNDFLSNAANQGASPSASTLSNPMGVYVHAGRLYIADNGNHRVLIFDELPTVNGAAADHVVGQPDFFTATPKTSATGFNGPQGISVDDDYLAVSEWSNSRVSFWPLASLLTAPRATAVFGQPDLDTSGTNTGGLSDRTLATTSDVKRVGAQYLVTDPGNNRVLGVLASAIGPSGAAAHLILGQASSTTNGAGSGWAELSAPLGLAFNGQQLVVVEYGNDRLAIFNSMPTVTGAAADLAWGGWGVDALHLSSPVGTWLTGSQLFVADRSNDRIMVFNGVPTDPSDSADVVLGQVDFAGSEHNQCSCTSAKANTLWGAHFVFVGPCRTIVADTQNNRVLIY